MLCGYVEEVVGDVFGRCVLVDEHTEHEVGIGVIFVLRLGMSEMPIGSQSRSIANKSSDFVSPNSVGFMNNQMTLRSSGIC